MNGTANEILENVNFDLLFWWKPMLLLGSLIGITLVALGIARLIRLGRSHGEGVRSALLSIVSGTLLINVVSGIMAATTDTLFAGSASAPTQLSYTPPAGMPEPLHPYLVFTVYVTTLVGFYGILRGTYLIHEIGRGRAQENGVWAALVHIVFGALAANIVATANAMGTTLGPTVRGFIQNILGSV